jgi:hypothetical protein
MAQSGDGFEAILAESFTAESSGFPGWPVGEPRQWSGAKWIAAKTCASSGPGGSAACAPFSGIWKVIHSGRIPLDRRHNAKIDYPAMRGILDSGNRQN